MSTIIIRNDIICFTNKLIRKSCMLLDRAFNLLEGLNECEKGVKLYDCTKYTYTAYANIQV